MSKFARVGCLALLMLVVALAIGVVPRWRQHTELANAASQKKDEAPMVIVTAPKIVQDPGFVLPGSTLASQTAILQARSTGFVTHYYADIGTVVKKGQLLATVSAPDVDAQYLQAAEQSIQSLATLNAADSDKNRLLAALQQARSQRNAALSSLVQARANADSYTAKVTTAERTADQARATMRYDEAQKVLAAREFQRYETVYEEGFVTKEQVDQMEASYKGAVAKVEADRQAVLADEAAVADAIATQRAQIAAMRVAEDNLRASEDNIKVASAAVVTGYNVIQEDQAALQASKANQQHYGALAGFSQVVAPFDGVITARNIEIGSLINIPATNSADTDPNNTAPRTGLYGVAALDPLEIDLRVPQSYYAAMNVGQKAEVYIREFPEERFQGNIFAVAGALDGASRTLQLKVRLANPKSRLRPGMYAEVHFPGPRIHPTMRIPSTALLVDAKGTRVAIVDTDYKIDLRHVKTGRDLGSETEILSGIGDKELVVVTPSDTMATGTKVRPFEADRSASATPSASPKPGATDTPFP